MAGTVDVFSRRALTKAVKTIIPAPKFFTQTFGRAGKAHPVTTIDIAKLSGKIKKAPLSNRGDGGKQIGHRKMKLETVSFPHIRPWKKFDIDTVVAVDITQPNIYENFDPQKLLSQKIAEDLQELKDMCAFTIEWMYWKMIVAGGFTYTDSEGVEVTINYNRSADSIITVTTDWDESTANPFKDFSNIDSYLQKTVGAPADTYIMGLDAWTYYGNCPKVTTTLDNRRIELGSIGGAMTNDYLYGYYKNRPIYVFGETDDDGTTPLMTADGLIAFNKRVMDFWHDFGLCTEISSGINPVSDFVSKLFEEQNPSAKYLLVETNPLPMCSNIDGVVYIDTKVT